MISYCSIEVIPAQSGGVTIWCNTCKETVAYKPEFFAVDEIVDTTAGHQRVMRAAREAAARS